MRPSEPALKMSELSLRDLHQRTVAISLTINQRPTVIAGFGTYYAQSELGPCLIVACNDGTGDCEFVFRDQDWLTTILPSTRSEDADFTIKLASIGDS